MVARVCTGCTTVYAVGAPCCPHCRSTDSVEQGETMPKITRHGGPTIAGAAVIGGAWSDSAAPDEWPDPTSAGAAESTPAEAAPAPDYFIRSDRRLSEEEYAALKAHVEGGDDLSPGSSSSPSSEKPVTNSEPSEPAAPKRARTTGSRSKKAPTGSSSAASTDGAKTDESSDN